MGVLFANRLKTTLSAAATAGATSLTLLSVASLPAIGGGDYCYLTLTSPDQATIEVVKATAVAGSVVTVARGQDGTTAAAWPLGTAVELRLNARAFSDFNSLFEPTSYASVAAIQAATIPAIVAHLRTRGYRTTGDGGAALYKRSVATSAGAGRIQSADGAWWDVAEATPNVLQFGAKPDGTADASAAFQASIDFLGVNGGRIIVPPGAYYCGTALVANAPVLFSGGTVGDTSTNPNGSGVVGQHPVLYWTGAAGTTILTYTPSSVGTVIFGGGIDGISFDGNNNAACAVHFDNCIGSIFDGDVRKVTDVGVDVSSVSGSGTAFSQRVWIRRLHFTYGTAAAVQNAHGLRLRGNGSTVPATQHQIGELSGLVYNGNLLDVAETDNLQANKVHGSVQSGGTGNALKLRAGGAQGANNNLFRYLVGPVSEDVGLRGNRFQHYVSEGGKIVSGSTWHGFLLDYTTGETYESHHYKLQKKINIAAGDWVGDAAVGAQDLGLQWRSISLPDAVTSSASAIVVDDFDLENGVITGVEVIVGTNGTSAGNYRLRIKFSTAAMDTPSGLVTPAIDDTSTYVAPATQYTMHRQTLTFGTPVNYTKGNALFLRVQRLGADALDTNTDAMSLLGARILYRGTGPNSAGSGTYSVPNW